MTNLDIAKKLGKGIYTQEETDVEVSNATPIGTVIVSPVNDIEEGFLECNGSELSRTIYNSLFNKIGTTYGSGNGSSTFKIPDLRGEFIRGFDNGRGVDSGRAISSWQGDLFRSHNHHHSMPSVWSVSGSGGVTFTSGSKAGNSNISSNTNATGGSETRPKNVAMMYCIKY